MHWSQHSMHWSKHCMHWSNTNNPTRIVDTVVHFQFLIDFWAKISLSPIQLLNGYFVTLFCQAAKHTNAGNNETEKGIFIDTTKPATPVEWNLPLTVIASTKRPNFRSIYWKCKGVRTATYNLAYWPNVLDKSWNALARAVTMTYENKTFV